MNYFASEAFSKAIDVYYKLDSWNDVNDFSLKEMYNFVYERFKVRGCFISAFVKGIAGAVYNFAKALFKTFKSLTQGNLGRDEALRNKAIIYYKDSAQDIIGVFISIVGVISPKGANWIDCKYKGLTEDSVVFPLI